MKNKKVTQATIVEQGTIKETQVVEEIALFNEDGVPYSGSDNTFEPIVVSTAAGTVAKTTTADEPKANTFLVINFTAGQSAESPTVSFNGGAAIPVYYCGFPVQAAFFTIAAGAHALMFFDGTKLRLI